MAEIYEINTINQNDSLLERIRKRLRKFTSKLKFFFSLSPNIIKHFEQNQGKKPEKINTTPKVEEAYDNILDEMKRLFNGQHPGEYLASISAEKRMAVIKEFIDSIRRIYGLDDLDVVFNYDSISSCGAFCRSENYKYVLLNQGYLDTNNPVLLLEFVSTILHEFRHAVQFNAMQGKNPLEFPEDLIKQWVENNLNYIRCANDPEGYRNQPVEWDAFTSEQHLMSTYLESV